LVKIELNGEGDPAVLQPPLLLNAATRAPWL
jgi:hypothetical protein